MKILLIDDEYINNVVTTKILSKIDPTLNVLKYTNPMLAYYEMMDLKPQLIFLDINMPMLSGWEFLDKMSDDNCTFPVVLLTSSVSKQDSVKALTYDNVMGYIQKPFSVDILSLYLKKAATISVSNRQVI